MLRYGHAPRRQSLDHRPRQLAALDPVRGSERGGTRAAFDADYETVQLTLTRRDRLDAAIAALAADSEFTPVVRRLGCLRGVSTLTALGLAVEIGDWDRFTGASIGAYLGLVPSEHSSGESRRQGPITKAGNTHARRLLIEAAWHHRPTYRVGLTMRGNAGSSPRAPPPHAATPEPAPAPPLAQPGRTQEAHDRPTPPSPVSSPGGAGPWRPFQNRPPEQADHALEPTDREQASTTGHPPTLRLCDSRPWRQPSRHVRDPVRQSLPNTTAVANPRISVSTPRR